MASTEEQAKQAEEVQPQQHQDQSQNTADPASSQPSSSTKSERGAQETSNAGMNSQVPLFGTPLYPWMFDPTGARWIQDFASTAGTRSNQPGMLPSMAPMLCPSVLLGQGQVDDQRFRNGGIFAVPMVPIIGPVMGYPPGGLIPVSYNIPPSSTIQSQSSERAEGAPAPAPGQEGVAAVPQAAAALAGQVQRPEGQRQVVRRFHVAFQIDLLLIMKLAVVIFIFNQDGSKDRLFLLLFLAGLVYLYQTGALTPLLRWISQSAQRAMMPPQPLQPVRPAAPVADGQARANLQADNVPANAAPANEPAGNDQGAAPPVVGDADAAAPNPAEQQPPQGHAWWGFLKEVQMLVVGFVTSLLPGFHQHID